MANKAADENRRIYTGSVELVFGDGPWMQKVNESLDYTFAHEETGWPCSRTRTAALRHADLAAEDVFKPGYRRTVVEGDVCYTGELKERWAPTFKLNVFSLSAQIGEPAFSRGQLSCAAQPTSGPFIAGYLGIYAAQWAGVAWSEMVAERANVR